MKKFYLSIIVYLVAVFAFAQMSYGVETITLPSSIELYNPTTNQVQVISYLLVPDSVFPYAKLTCRVLDSEGRLYKEHTVWVRNELDNPDTPENEATTTLTTFADGWWTTMHTRAKALMWADLQNRYTVVTP